MCQPEQSGAATEDGPSDLAPRCNLQATRVDDVYVRKDVITEDEWDSLAIQQILDMAKDPSIDGVAELPSYIRGQLSALIACQDKRESKRKAKLLMYAFFLILFNQLPSRYRALPVRVCTPFSSGPVF